MNPVEGQTLNMELTSWMYGSTAESVIRPFKKNEQNLNFQQTFIWRGSDQHRGWFQTSLMSSMAAFGVPPYRALVTHGFVNDADGYKMSKSKGNVIDPSCCRKAVWR